MRFLAVTVLTLSGCFASSEHCYRVDGKAAIAVAAIETAALIVDAVIHDQRPEPDAPPPPSGIRDYWRGPTLPCKDGRSMHQRCVTAASGHSCFWETDEGTLFDCPDDKCQTIPANLAAWCY
jgi:hypothetical protein